MRHKKLFISLVLLALLAFSAWGQGMMIRIMMRGISRKVDERFHIGRFYWKPILPPLFRPSKLAIMPAEHKEMNYAPPFFKIEKAK